MEQAEAAYRRALELEAGNARALAGLGTLLLRRGKFEQALEQLRLAVQADPEWARPRSDMGLVYMQLGQWDNAAKAYQEALDLVRAIPTLSASWVSSISARATSRVPSMCCKRLWRWIPIWPRPTVIWGSLLPGPTASTRPSAPTKGPSPSTFGFQEPLQPGRSPFQTGALGPGYRGLQALPGDRSRRPQRPLQPGLVFERLKMNSECIDQLQEGYRIATRKRSEQFLEKSEKS